ncbi:MAG: hypothetical protein CVU89_06380 [Firmicutes bacterium HGW-Firmicutes-14]|nr:MAG: hypothetical protein CVU89_06380 [Firmicutes bacterium HGW-Firmicutes-14]
MLGIGKSIIFFLKVLLFGVGTLAVIPKTVYKKFLVYGLFLGAVMDICVILLLEKLNIIMYYNMGPFSILGYFPFWTPIAWMFAMMLFLYFMPKQRLLLYAYILTFAAFGVMVGIMLKNFGLYRLNMYALFFAFLLWFSFAAWVYIYLESEGE